MHSLSHDCVRSSSLQPKKKKIVSLVVCLWMLCRVLSLHCWAFLFFFLFSVSHSLSVHLFLLCVQLTVSLKWVRNHTSSIYFFEWLFSILNFKIVQKALFPTRTGIAIVIRSVNLTNKIWFNAERLNHLWYKKKEITSIVMRLILFLFVNFDDWKI